MLKPLQISIAFLLGALAVPTFGQTQTAGPLAQGKPAPQYTQNAQPTGPIPDHIIYLQFFRLLRATDDLAHRRYVEGHPELSEAWHSHVKTKAGLTARENEILKAVGADCVKQIEASQSTWAASHPHLRPPLDEATANELKVAQERDAQIIFAHVEQLRTAFGPKRFPKLDRYMRYEMRNMQMHPVDRRTQN